jgi:hypothetical protein
LLYKARTQALGSNFGNEKGVKFLNTPLSVKPFREVNRTPHQVNYKLLRQSDLLFSMKIITIIVLVTLCGGAIAQTKEDTLAIRKASLDYIESQHKPNPRQMEAALHPRLVKRTFWKDKVTGKEFLDENFADNMIILAERYNIKGDRFPASPRKDLKLLDVSDRTASVKLYADDWIDYMHLVKVNGQWKIINVLWQYNNSSKHQ